MVALQNLTIMRQRLAIEGQDLRRRIGGDVAGRLHQETHVAEAESKVDRGVGIFVVWIFIGCGARILRQSDIRSGDVSVGMQRQIEVRILFGIRILSYAGGAAGGKNRRDQNRRRD